MIVGACNIWCSSVFNRETKLFCQINSNEIWKCRFNVLHDFSYVELRSVACEPIIKCLSLTWKWFKVQMSHSKLIILSFHVRKIITSSTQCTESESDEKSLICSKKHTESKEQSIMSTSTDCLRGEILSTLMSETTFSGFRSLFQGWGEFGVFLYHSEWSRKNIRHHEIKM